ncbi:hypothetical protein [Umezawaea sp. Da 62-37]|uniref:hypothetical protein n=1 Tax=Umezawaea sp. Da 62-37 TaxID=3075927 RepID=UPI0028F74F78|nr:hypothetical protein [Umezawaea sp. Da 62-37]WNV88793.1 hypothetical protein RM788_10980 [Umezawaea sp. Da 62-37]
MNTGRLTGLAAVAAVLATTACMPATDGGPPAVRSFGAEGWGPLTPGMTKQEALATGELSPEPLAVIGGCDYYSFANGPVPDPALLAADQANDVAYRDAVHRVEDLSTKVGPSPAPDAPADEQLAWAARSADAARAVSAVAVIASTATDRVAQIAGPANPAGVVSFGQGRLRLIGAPGSARTEDGIGRGSTLAELRKTYLGRGLGLTSPGRYEMPAHGRAGWMLDFDFDAITGEVVFVQLRDTKAKCP